MFLCARFYACPRSRLHRSSLVDEFAVFNNWHAAIPGPTLTNRQFADSCTSDGYGDYTNLDVAFGFPQRTIFQVGYYYSRQVLLVSMFVELLSRMCLMQDLDEANVTWGVYFDLVPTSWQFQYTRGKLDHYKVFDEFTVDAAAGNLPSYSEQPCCCYLCAVFVIECVCSCSLHRPRLLRLLRVSSPVSTGDPLVCLLMCASHCRRAASDQHPDHDVAVGEAFMKTV